MVYPNYGEHPSRHEAATLKGIAKRLAALKSYGFGGLYDSSVGYSGNLYFVPAATITDCETARRIGIDREDDLFGGVVPYPYMATKTIAHPLVDPQAFAPEGWSDAFAGRVKGATLFGFSAFTLNDARRAGAVVLDHGPARVKPGNGVGGRGQAVVSNAHELNKILTALGDATISRHGVVIEQNLDHVTTFSIGQVRLSNLVATYYGKQSLTKDNHGLDVYGGSDLLVVRGDYDRLLKLALQAEVSLAINQARAYDTAAQEIVGLIASRRNYDVAQGRDSHRHRCSGVLEQSWRIGGASAAELAALEAFQSNPALQTVRATCVEAYGVHEPPRNAMLQFHELDDCVGPITKYTLVDTHAAQL